MRATALDRISRALSTASPDAAALAVLDVLTEATADLAWALLLAAARRVTESERYVRSGKWKQWDWTALRGHDVQLHEAQGRLGGTVFFSSIVYPENGKLIDYLAREMDALGVLVRLNSRVTRESAAAIRPDVVIVAPRHAMRVV